MLITERQNRLFNAQANVLAIHPLQGLMTERVPEWLEDFIDFISDRDADHPLLQALPALQRLVGQDELPPYEDFLDAIQCGNEKGYLFYCDWEVRRYLDECAFVSGPGYRRITWIYTDDIDAGFDALIAAAEADHERQRAKVGAA
ncbi:hypothetical protein GRI33_07090 [Brucella sp. BO3]|uniref:hypothetical protein n=1 Tax=unclassified Brucella TaxID=2632610 RepID=UPI00084F9D01|nr:MULTISPECIES: hypothetical protein [unclassified Brucella]OEI84661.1 hypothetical protein BA060_02190 [Brucella sp. B13-0095]QMV26701.1 hypothetical protein GRI33_07090 [Brucella sp. BO3]